MPKKTTLAKVEQDLAEGKLGLARDRLYGLLTSYPDDFEIREKLGDVYYQLGYSADVGRCWFFVMDSDERQKEAIDAFMKSCNHNVDGIVKRLKMGIVLGHGKEKLTRDQVLELVTAAYRDRKSVGKSYGSEGLESRHESRIWPTWVIGTSCLVIVLLIVFGVGVYTVLTWLRALLGR